MKENKNNSAILNKINDLTLKTQSNRYIVSASGLVTKLPEQISYEERMELMRGYK